eukprot:scaffold100487_cov36-Phaeocystis_antarctica.AAC.1
MAMAAEATGGEATAEASVTKMRPPFAFSSQPESTLNGRVVQGHDRPSAVAVHSDEVVHPPSHCILTFNPDPSFGTSLNAFGPMTRLLASYLTVSVCMFEPLNACCSIRAQPEVRIPHSSGKV